MVKLIDGVPHAVWFLVGPMVVGIIATVRIRLNKLGVNAADAFLWLFLRRVRRAVSVSVNLRRYCLLGLAAPATAALQVPGLADDIALKTDDAFVNLTFESNSNDRETYSNLNVLAAGNRLRVIGDPGSGKSSLVKRLFRDLCREGSSQPRSARLPILVELRDLNVPGGLIKDSEVENWIVDRMRSIVAGVEGYDMAGLFDLAARQSGLVILLDGLDEVATDAYPRTAHALRSLSRRLSVLGENNSVVLTMRAQFHQQVRKDLERDFPLTLHVKPFSNSDVYEFLSRWFRKRGDGQATANKIYSELADRPSLRDMCTNPLILSMYTANFDNVAGADLPDTRTEFYRSVLDELLVKRRSRQTSTRTGRVVQREQRYEIFGAIAQRNLSNYDQPANSASWDQSVEIVDQVLELHDHKRAARFLAELGKETGVFQQERPGETIRFIHLTICEYLAAVEWVSMDQAGWTDLLQSHQGAMQSAKSEARTRLIEVVPFAAALVIRRERRQMLDRVYRLGDMELYARCLLETQDYGHPQFIAYVREEREALVGTPSDAWDDKWLNGLHLYQTVVAEASVIGISEPAGIQRGMLDRLFVDLVSDRRDRLVRLFSSYASDNPVAAFELADSCGVDLLRDAASIVVDECANQPFLFACIDRLSTDRRIVDWAAVLSEAALRNRLVAQLLAKHLAPRDWIDFAGDLPRRCDWTGVANAKNRQSLLGLAVSIALFSGSSVMGRIEPRRLERLARVRAPGALIRSLFPPASLAILSIFAAFVVKRGLLPETNLPMEVAFVAIFEVAGAWAIFSVVYLCLRRRAYRTLLNLDNLRLSSRFRLIVANGEIWNPLAPFAFVRTAFRICDRRLYRALVVKVVPGEEVADKEVGI